MPAERGGGPASVWDTFRRERTILMACRTLTSTIRLLETHDLFRGDFRLEWIYTLDEGSRFGAGAERLLARAGVDRVVPWSDVDRVRPHLTLAASENIDPAAVPGRILVLPHGVGFNKYVPTADGGGRRIAGLPAPAALRTGRVLVVLAHPDQETQLRSVCPEIAGHTVVIGDAVFDRLEASTRQRDRYRRLLHAGDRQLVLVSSTWGTESALGDWGTLPRQVVAALPVDRYRVCLALHPNIWARYGPRAIRVYLADALDAGLVLLPPESGWQPAMIAADLVIADHGSLSLYAAALGRSLLVVGDATETVPETPLANLVGTAPRLAGRARLTAQIDAAISVPTNRFQHLGDRVFSHRGQAVRRLREEVYGALRLPPPDGEEPLPRIPDPRPEHYGPWSFRVHVDATADVVRLTRYAAAAHPDGDEGHLVVTEAEANLRLTERASVLCREHRTDRDRAREWTETALAAYPGARLAAAGIDHGCLVACRDGRHAVLSAPDADVTLLASLAYHCLVTDRLTPRTVTLSAGRHNVHVKITTG